ncbi:MAG: hypothetical protein Q8P57_05385 [Candidatus Pacearchaeota archaeon]|nr:hypothetical protein [Candidatus Pacearchaeota archaeon]
MNLDLNEPVHYRSFRDEEKGIVTYAWQMPEIIGIWGWRPAEPGDIFERKIGPENSNWMNLHFFTDMGVVVPPIGAYGDVRFKLRRNSESLLGITPKTILTPHGFILHSSYDDVLGVEFIEGENGVIVRRDMREGEALENSALLEILGGNESFRDAVVDKMFFEGKRLYSFKKMMGLYTPILSDVAQEGALYVGRLEVGSQVGSSNRLDFDYAQLVGVAPEVPHWLERFRAGRVA